MLFSRSRGMKKRWRTNVVLDPRLRGGRLWPFFQLEVGVPATGSTGRRGIHDKLSTAVDLRTGHVRHRTSTP